MNRQRTFVSIVVLAIALMLPVLAFAATAPGLKPGNFFYIFDTASEKIALFFAFSPGKKANKALEYADERLAEIENIAEEKNPDAVKTALANYESNVALATEKSKEVKDKGRAETLLTSIADNASRNQEVLAAVLVKVPEEAKEAITQAIKASRRGQEEATKQITEIKGEVERLKQEVVELKKESNSSLVDEVEKLKQEIEELKKTKETSHDTPSNTQQIGQKNVKSGNYIDILAQIMPRMVRLTCMGPNGKAGGSGTTQLVDNQSPVIVTNFHVVALGVPYEVYCFVNITQPPDYSSFKGKTLLARVGKFDTHYQENGLDSIDVAVLHIEGASSAELEMYFSKFPLPFCKSGQIKIGEEITIFGYPAFGGESLTVTNGIISGLLQTRWGPVYKTSAKFDGGVSGGLAIENKIGCVIGIPTWKTSGLTEGAYGQLDITEGLGLIQPWETIKNSGDIF